MLQVLALNPPAIENMLLNTSVEDRSLIVHLANLQKEKTVITLESVDQREVYHEQIINEHNGFKTRWNLREMPKGRYVLKVKQGSNTLRQVVVIDQNSIMTSKVAEGK
jgi:hypothetical protein